MLLERPDCPGIPTNYLYDGDSLFEELDQSGNVLARYSQGPPLIDEPLAELRAGTTSYYEQDDLSSVTSLNNAAGALANTYSYDSFGNLTASTGSLTNPFQFTGRDNDLETALYYYRARYFDPKVGRFISEDPLGIRDNLNMYLYVRNNPVNFDDPFVCMRPGDSQAISKSNSRTQSVKLSQNCATRAPAARELTAPRLPTRSRMRHLFTSPR